MVRHDEERRPVTDTGLLHCVDDCANLSVQVRHRGLRGKRVRAVAVLHGIERQKVEHHEVRLVHPNDVGRGLGPDVVPQDDVLRPEGLDVLSRHDAGGDHLLCDRSVRVRPLPELPCHRWRVPDGHPVYLRCRESVSVRDVVQRLRVDHLALVAPRLDPRGQTGLAHQQTVVNDAMFRGRDARNHGRVVRPRDRRVDGSHGFRRRARRREAAQVRQRQRRIRERARRESVEADDDDVIGGSGALRVRRQMRKMHGDGEQRKHSVETNHGEERSRDDSWRKLPACGAMAVAESAHSRHRRNRSRGKPLGTLLAVGSSRMAGMRAADPRVSYAELATWPDDGRRWELYAGEPIAVPTPNWRHQRVIVKLAGILGEYEHLGGGGVVVAPFDIVLSDYDVLQPDVVFFGREKRARLNPLEVGYLVPDLVVEVLSRSTEARDRGRKMAVFARHELPESWLVDAQARELEVYARSAGSLSLIRVFESGNRVSSATLPGLSFDLDRLFTD